MPILGPAIRLGRCATGLTAIARRLKKGMLRNPFAAVPLAYPQNLARLRPADGVLQPFLTW